MDEEAFLEPELLLAFVLSLKAGGGLGLLFGGDLTPPFIAN